jgi:hypothetical protein
VLPPQWSSFDGKGRKRDKKNYKQARLEKRRDICHLGGNYFDMRRFTPLN